MYKGAIYCTIVALRRAVICKIHSHKYIYNDSVPKSHVNTHTHTHTHTHARTHTCTHAHTHTYAHACTELEQQLLGKWECKKLQRFVWDFSRISRAAKCEQHWRYNHAGSCEGLVTRYVQYLAAQPYNGIL